MKATSRHLLGAFAVVAVAWASSAEASAPAGRYTIAGGTVTDTKTKLTWQQTLPAATYAWAAAKTYCRTLSLAGTGWRLPTSKELQTLLDYSRSNPAIDPAAFPATPTASFWSSSLLASDPPGSNAWVVDFSLGQPYTDIVENAYNVRCVR